MPPFDVDADFDLIAEDLAFPGTVTVHQIDADSGLIQDSADDVAAVGRTTDATPVAVGDGGEVLPKAKRWWLRASQIPWLLSRRDQVSTTGGVYEIESVSLVAFDAVYRCESHYIGPSTPETALTSESGDALLTEDGEFLLTE